MRCSFWKWHVADRYLTLCWSRKGVRCGPYRGTSSARTQVSSSMGLHQFFSWIESRFGGNLPMDMSNTPAGTVIERDKYLEPDDLIRLTSHQALAIHVRQFYFPVSAAMSLGQSLADDAILRGQGKNWKISTSRGLESSDVATLGEHAPYNVAIAATMSGSTKGNTIDEYFAGVQRELRNRRVAKILTSKSSNNTEENSIMPQLWPLDLLRLHLDEIWPSGASLAREATKYDQNTGHYPRPFSGGLPRIMCGPTRWRQGFIHVDEMGPLNPNSGLFSANIYLQLPSESKQKSGVDPLPALEIWPLGIRNRWDWYRNAILLSGLSSQDAEMQFRLRHKLGQPVKLQVAPGDLVILSVQRPHAAIGFANPKAVRVSLQCFLQYSGVDHRLLIDN
jgi:hypothetical protein